MAIIPQSTQQALDGSGVPISGATLTVEVAGSTSLAAVYSDHDYQTVASNPATADASGRFAGLYAPQGSYKITLRDAGGVTIYTYDHVDVNDLASSVVILTDVEGALKPYQFGAQAANTILANNTPQSDVPQWVSASDLVSVFADAEFPSFTIAGTLKSTTAFRNILFSDPDYSSEFFGAMYVDDQGVIQFLTPLDRSTGTDSTVSARIDDRSTLDLAVAHSIVTREKGDKRYVRFDPGTANNLLILQNTAQQFRIRHTTFSTTNSAAIYVDSNGHLQFQSAVDNVDGTFTTSARVDARSEGDVPATAHSIIIRASGDARYVRQGVAGAVSDATSSSDVVTRFNELLDRLQTVGLLP